MPSVGSSCLLFASFTQQVREQHPPCPRPTCHPLSDQQSRELVLAAATVFTVLILTLVLFLSGFTSLTEQVREQHPPCPRPTCHTLSDQQSRELVLAAATVFTVLTLTLVLFLSGFTSLA
jgi:hypothetical protein